MVMYDQDCINWMKARQKSETRRLYNPDKRPGIPGSIHWIKKDRTKTVYGQYLVLSCEPQRFGDITDEDAHHEGNFKNAQEYKEYFYSVNGHIEDDDLVWVMKFVILWTYKEGWAIDEQHKKNTTNVVKMLLKLHNDLQEKFNAYTPYGKDPIHPFPSIKEGLITLCNIKDEDIYNYINNNTDHKVIYINHNDDSSSTIRIMLNKHEFIRRRSKK